MISRKELLSKLNEFEKKYPVNEWIYDNVWVWPLIKIDFFFRVVAAENRDAMLPKTKKKVSIPKKVKFTIKSIIHLIFLWLKRPDKTPTILFSDSRAYRIDYNNAFIDRYFQPMFDWLELNRSGWKSLTLSDDVQFNLYPKNELIFFSYKYHYVGVLFQKLRKKNKKFDALHFNEFKSFLKYTELGDDIPFYENRIKEMISEIKATKVFTDLIFKKYNIKKVFELCYYSNLRYAVNLSARENNIETIEIQHGGMGPEHVSYSGWNKVPEQGYNIFPKTFWTWDRASFDLINTWILEQNYHKVICGGNPWIDYILSYRDKGNFIFPKNKKIILYTMQYAAIEDYILEAIKDTPAGYQWWLRLHPRKTEAKAHILDRLKANRLDRIVEIEKATAYPLPVILMHSAIHLSGSSGSIIEAAQLGVTSLILEKAGQYYYQSYVKQGIAIPETNHSATNLLEKIRQYSEKKVEDISKIYNKRFDIVLEKLMEN